MPRLCWQPPGGSIVSSFPFMPLRKSSGSHSSTNGAKPHISGVSPVAAIPGGDFQIHGAGLIGGTETVGNQLTGGERPLVRFGRNQAHIVVGSDRYVIARVPAGP